jgi:hypothetical protein
MKSQLKMSVDNPVKPGMAVAVEALSPLACALWKKASTQASPVDRKGNWIDSGLIAEFGLDAVNELANAGLIVHTVKAHGGYIDVIKPYPHGH